MSAPHRQYFNNLASTWDERMGDAKSLADHFVQWGIAEGDVVLDLGCGSGRSSTMLSQAVGSQGHVLAADLAEAMVKAGRKSRYSKNIDWLCSDAGALSVKGGSVDKVLCYSVYPHFTEPQQVLSELHRLLKAGGRLIIHHETDHKSLNEFHAKLDGPVRHDRLPSAGDMADRLQHMGFVIELCQENQTEYTVIARR